MKLLHRYTVRGCGVFHVMRRGGRGGWINKRPTSDTGVWLKTFKVSKKCTLATTMCLCTGYIYTPLALTFIKGFPQITKMTAKLIIHLIMVMPPYYSLPCFLPLSLLLQKHINQERIHRTPGTQCTGGYPLTILTRLQFKFLLTFQFPNPRLGCRKITLSPCSPLHYSLFL